MGQILQVEFPILQSLVDTVNSPQMACMRISGELTLWGQEMGARENGLAAYRSMLESLASSSLSAATNSADCIASLGILKRKNQISIQYDPITYPVLESAKTNYQYDVGSSLLTFNTLLEMLRGSNINLING